MNRYSWAQDSKRNTSNNDNENKTTSDDRRRDGLEKTQSQSSNRDNDNTNLLQKRSWQNREKSTAADKINLEEGDDRDPRIVVNDEVDNIFKKTKLNNNDERKKISYAMNSNNGVSIETEMQLAPWISKSTLRIKNTLIRFHNEIIDFSKYVSPSEEEHLKREAAFQKLKTIVTDLLPDAQVHCFGSFVTKVYLPNADIDLVVLKPNTPNSTILHKLAKVLMKRSEDYGQIQVIKSAKVPLIKLVDKQNNLNFDISFNKLDGVNQIREVEKGLKHYPEMRHLIFVLKCLLKQRDLNETYTGGIGSFLLFCLVLTFLREFRRKYLETDKADLLKTVLLSEYLMKFFEFYGINFDVNSKAIVMVDGGSIIEKYSKDYALSVISPQDQAHDIGGPSYKIKEVFGVFKNRYHFLTNYNVKENESILKFLMHANVFGSDYGNKE
jgi:non-canonical poly(A) RNA polymerase PAPD5/7